MKSKQLIDGESQDKIVKVVPVKRDLTPVSPENYFWAKKLDIRGIDYSYFEVYLRGDISTYGFKRLPVGQDIYTLEGLPNAGYYKIIFNQSREMLADIMSKDKEG